MARCFAAFAFVAFSLSIVAATVFNKACAQDGYPARPVKFIIPYPGGGTNDVLARIVGDKLQAKWGQPVIIENRSGGGGNIGAAAVAQAEPDGYTLLVSATPPLATNQSLYKELSYKPEDFVPITNLGSVPNLVIVRKRLPVNSVSELIAYANANPGKLVYGSQGAGNTPHLTANMFMNMTGTSMVHVPYRGETLIYNDMLGERVDVFFGNIAGAFALYHDGKLKVLAVTDKARAAAMPDVPTSAEVGSPTFSRAPGTRWWGHPGSSRNCRIRSRGPPSRCSRCPMCSSASARSMSSRTAGRRPKRRPSLKRKSGAGAR